MGDTRMRKISERELTHAAVILADAFEDDPLWRYLLSSFPDQRGMRLKIYRALVEIEWTQGRLMGEGHPLKGVVMWKPHLTRKQPLLRRVRALLGMYRLITSTFLVMGLRATKVMFKFWQLERKHAKHPCYHLLMLAVSPSMQRKGIASKLLKPVLNLADTEGVGIYVDTAASRNVEMYEHLGFEVKEEFAHELSGLKGWGLYRQPRQVRLDLVDEPHPS